MVPAARHAPQVKDGDVWWGPVDSYWDNIGEVITYHKCPKDPERTMSMGSLHVDGDMRIAYHGLPPYAVGNVARNSFRLQIMLSEVINLLMINQELM